MNFLQHLEWFFLTQTGQMNCFKETISHTPPGQQWDLVRGCYKNGLSPESDGQALMALIQSLLEVFCQCFLGIKNLFVRTDFKLGSKS